MPALNFSAEFASAVQNGTKRQTIRPKRKRPIQWSDYLYFYTGQRTRSCRKLGESVCLAVRDICIVTEGRQVAIDGLKLTTTEVENLAKDDGFDSVGAFFAWFEGRYGPEFNGVLITW